jgi:hypothetical protein
MRQNQIKFTENIRDGFGAAQDGSFSVSLARV